MEIHESYGDIPALEADIVKLSERLASAYRAKARCNDDANFERRRAVSAEAEVARLTDALKPFADEATEFNNEYREDWRAADDSEIVSSVFVDLTFGDFRRARDTLAALKGSTDAQA